MRQRPINMPVSGLAKVQRLPYSCWDELKVLKSRNAALEFLMAHRETEKIFTQELGEGAAERIIRKGRFKDNADRDFADEAYKSCILRAAGSAKASWNPWSVSQDGFSAASFGSDSLVVIKQPGGEYGFDVPYGIQVGMGAFDAIKATAAILAERLDPEGDKRIFRIDFTLESNGGKIQPWLVDFGESHYTFVLGTEIHAARGTRQDLVSGYLDAVGLPNGTGRVWMVYQSDKTLSDMPWELEGVKSAIENRGLEAVHLSLPKFLSRLREGVSLEQGRDLVLRFFRQADQKTILQLQGATGNKQIFADPLKFIPMLQKQEVHKLIEGVRKELSGAVCIPRSASFALKQRPKDTRSEIERWAVSQGIEEIVVKPGNCNAHPNAFFYRLDNPHHQQELERALGKMWRGNVLSAVVEEMAGNGSIDGRKAELRFWMFG